MAERDIFVADAEKAAERHDRIGNFPGEFIDHDPLDRAQFFTIAPANRRALDFVACDQPSSNSGSNSNCHLHRLVNVDTWRTEAEGDKFQQSEM